MLVLELEFKRLSADLLEELIAAVAVSPVEERLLLITSLLGCNEYEDMDILVACVPPSAEERRPLPTDPFLHALRALRELRCLLQDDTEEEKDEEEDMVAEENMQLWLCY